jgi:hypothetical protein
MPNFEVELLLRVTKFLVVDIAISEKEGHQDYAFNALNFLIQ